MPTYHRFEMTKRCIESIIPHVNSSIYDTTLYICDNNSSKEMVEWLETKVTNKIVLYKSNKNIGKAKIVNKVHNANKNCTHVISLDSDMIAEKGYNWIDVFVWCIEHFTDFGLLSTTQIGNDQHIWKGLTDVKELPDYTHKVYHGRFDNVAGGCVIMKQPLWNTIGGYNEVGNVYGFDDGHLMQDMYTRKKLVGVISSVRLEHPHDLDGEYKKWKQINIGKRQLKGFYDS